MTNTSRQTFETALERIRGSFGLCVYGYVVMPEHVHLLTGEPQRKTQSIFTSTLHSQVRRSAAFLEEKPHRERLLCIHQ